MATKLQASTAAGEALLKVINYPSSLAAPSRGHLNLPSSAVLKFFTTKYPGHFHAIGVGPMAQASICQLHHPALKTQAYAEL